MEIYSDAELWQNGFTDTLQHWAPDLPASYVTPMTDAAKSGWILAKDSTGDQSGLAMPVIVTTDQPAMGVDTFSLTSPEGCKERGDWRMWIMAPAATGMSTEVTLQSLASSNGPLNLTLPAGIAIDEDTSAATIQTPSIPLSFRATNPDDTGKDLLASLSLGATNPVASLSKPIGFKVMKHRYVNVMVYQITQANTGNTADLVPTVIQMTDYLNKVFKPQLNVDFIVRMESAPVSVDWDLPDGSGVRDGVLDIAPTASTPSNALSAEQKSIDQAVAKPENTNITVYLLGTDHLLGSGAWGNTSVPTKTCWLVADPLNYPDTVRVGQPRTISDVLNTMAHEIGHVMVGPGHPDQEKGNPGPAPLPGSDHRQRLMASGQLGEGRGKLLVKGEWDAAETWLEANIPNDP